MGDSRIDRRAFLELVVRGVPSLVALGAEFQITSVGWTSTRYSLDDDCRRRGRARRSGSRGRAHHPIRMRTCRRAGHTIPTATTAVRPLKLGKLWIAKDQLHHYYAAPYYAA